MSSAQDMQEKVEQAARDLLLYCKERDWAGYDPYDALNSRVFARVPFVHNRPARIVFTQLMKRSPVNFRPLLGVAPAQNPKGLALFISALLRLKQSGIEELDEPLAVLLRDLLKHRSPQQDESCWGYHFSWQTRTHLVPLGTPNIICTTFAGQALLDAYEASGEAEYLQVAESAGRFLVTGLNIFREGDSMCFSYTPVDESKIHNANFLGAAFLSRLYAHTHHEEWRKDALASARYSAAGQQENGAWVYGERHTQKWVDNFHTGFNLMALRQIDTYVGEGQFRESIRKGYRFYLDHFFREDGAPRYFSDRTYPIDIHSASQSLITLSSLRDLDKASMERASRVFQWASKHMRDESGYYYFQKGRVLTNKISYMRWSQSWMLLALAVYACALNEAAAEK